MQCPHFPPSCTKLRPHPPHPAHLVSAGRYVIGGGVQPTLCFGHAVAWHSLEQYRVDLQRAQRIWAASFPQWPQAWAVAASAIFVYRLKEMLFEHEIWARDTWPLFFDSLRPPWGIDHRMRFQRLTISTSELGQEATPSLAAPPEASAWPHLLFASL